MSRKSRPQQTICQVYLTSTAETNRRVCRTSYLTIGMGRRVFHSDFALLLEQRLTNTRQNRLRPRRRILHLGRLISLLFSAIECCSLWCRCDSFGTHGTSRAQRRLMIEGRSRESRDRIVEFSQNLHFYETVKWEL